jgi:hypothetical protein
MYQIPITAVPNQAISFNVDGAYWQLHIYQSITHMCVDIIQSGATIISGHRCFVGIPLMPYAYMNEPNFGNFLFDGIVDWTEFGSGCNLYYLTADEWVAYKASGYLEVNG